MSNKASIESNVEYRLLQPDEEGAVLDLWCELFLDSERARWRHQFVWDANRFQRTHIAIDSAGNVLSTIRYLLRTIYSATGYSATGYNESAEPVSVGWVTNVATKASAQRQGHAGKLLELTLEAMRQQGCRWSLLSAEEEAVGVYERHGWRRFPLRYRQGLLAKRELPSSSRYLALPFDPLQRSDGWQKVAAVYEKYNRGRPLSVVRDQSYWQSYIAMRFADWQEYAGAELLVASPASDNTTVSGYAVALFSEMGVLVSELCALREELEVIPTLLNAIHDELRKRNFPEQGRVYLPHELYLDQAIAQFFDATLHEGYDYFLLARTLADDGDESQLDAAFAAPNGIHWLLDEY